MIPKLYRLLKPFFKGSMKKYAIWMGLLVVTLSVAQVGLTFLFNAWRGRFYDAIQAYEVNTFWYEFMVFTVLAMIAVVVYTLGNYALQLYTVKWREWQTHEFLDKWVITPEIDNPDQRVQDDIRLFTDLVARLFTGFMNALLSIIIFTPILWSLSKSITLFGYHIEGSLWYASAGFTLLGSVLCFRLGKKLNPLQYSNQRTEANFRFEMVKLREGKIFAYNPSLRDSFNIVLYNYRHLYQQFKVFGFASSSYFQIAIILPFLIAAPSYFTHAITLGILMQIGNAFDVVNQSMSYLLDRWIDITQLQSVTNRLTELSEKLQ